MSEKLVYLAGPITGLSYDGAVNWREHAVNKLAHCGIKGLSPMRCKEYLLEETSIADRYDEHVLSTSKAITTRDRWDCMRSEVILMNLVGAERVSIGTMIEAGWADAFRKPVVLAIEEGNMHHHAMLEHISGWIVPDLDQAIDVTKALLA